MNIYFASQTGYVFHKNGLTYNNKLLHSKHIGCVIVNSNELIIIDRISHMHASTLNQDVLIHMIKTVQKTLPIETLITIYLPQMHKLLFAECIFQNKLQNLNNIDIIYL